MVKKRIKQHSLVKEGLILTEHEGMRFYTSSISLDSGHIFAPYISVSSRYSTRAITNEHTTDTIVNLDYTALYGDLATRYGNVTIDTRYYGSVDPYMDSTTTGIEPILHHPTNYSTGMTITFSD